ncbi:MAG: hypothetical protein AVDCRST_MAG30-3158, partial [uncultured Solirubrobacteraceae bacterium]
GTDLRDADRSIRLRGADPHLRLAARRARLRVAVPRPRRTRRLAAAHRGELRAGEAARQGEGGELGARPVPRRDPGGQAAQGARPAVRGRRASWLYTVPGSVERARPRRAADALAGDRADRDLRPRRLGGQRLPADLLRLGHGARRRRGEEIGRL